MARRLKTNMADKLKVKRIVKKKRVSKGTQYQNELKTRSGFETKVVDLLNNYNVKFDYENKSKKIKYTVPAKDRTYLCDFIITCESTGQEYYIETKGRFVDLDERMKYLYVQEQNPSVKLIMCFMNPNLPINKGSKTTYRSWFESKGITSIDFKQLDKLMKHYTTTKKIDLRILLN